MTDKPMTVADVWRMLHPDAEPKRGAATPPAGVPADAVSATMASGPQASETVQEAPLKTIETVQVVVPAVPKRRR